MRVYFGDTAERDRLATEIGAEEASTRGGFLTKWGDRDLYNSLLARGLRVEIDEEATRQANISFASDDPDTFYGGYRTVEEMQAFLDQKVAANPLLAEKIDIGDSWCKTHPGVCTQPNAWSGYDLWVLHITNRDIAGSEAGLLVRRGHTLPRDCHARSGYALHQLSAGQLQHRCGCALAGGLPRHLDHADVEPRWAPYERVEWAGPAYFPSQERRQG